MKNLSKFKFSYPIQMRWDDLDALGHVNNAAFQTYFEIARGDYMTTSCKEWDWQKHMFLIGKVEISFHKELFLSAKNMRVMVRTSRMGTKSFVLEYVIVSNENGEQIIHATGITIQIMIDLKSRKTIAVPDWIREQLTAFES